MIVIAWVNEGINPKKGFKNSLAKPGFNFFSRNTIWGFKELSLKEKGRALIKGFWGHWNLG